MRQFVVLGHTATTDPGFSLDDLAGGTGRLDVLCRCVTAGLLISHGIREDARVTVVLQGALTIRFEGAELRHLSPDERSAASLFRRAFEESEGAVGHAEVESTPGVHVSKRDAEGVIRSAADGGVVVQLHEEGSSVTDLAPPSNPTFVLSDHQEFAPTETALLDELADERISLGPVPIHADQAIVVANNYLDTSGYTSY